MTETAAVFYVDGESLSPSSHLIICHPLPCDCVSHIIFESSALPAVHSFRVCVVARKARQHTNSRQAHESMAGGWSGAGNGTSSIRSHQEHLEQGAARREHCRSMGNEIRKRKWSCAWLWLEEWIRAECNKVNYSSSNFSYCQTGKRIQ